MEAFRAGPGAKELRRIRILIDADGCPVVDRTIALAKKYGAEVVILCDTAHVFEKEGAETIVVPKGADSADFRLANMARRGDIVITQDYGLAAMCLAKGAAPLSQNGMLYTERNIDGPLSFRHISKKIRAGGGRLKGPPKRAKAQDEAFSAALERLIKELSGAPG